MDRYKVCFHKTLTGQFCEKNFHWELDVYRFKQENKFEEKTKPVGTDETSIESYFFKVQLVLCCKNRKNSVNHRRTITVTICGEQYSTFEEK